MKTRKIELTTEGARSKVIVDGKDMSHLVRGYTLTHNAGEVPTLTLELNAIDTTAIGDVFVEDRGPLKTKPDMARKANIALGSSATFLVLSLFTRQLGIRFMVCAAVALLAILIWTCPIWAQGGGR